MRSFTLITQVPDRVVRWFGQGGENLNEEQDSRAAVALLNSQSENRVGQAAGMAAVTRKEEDAPSMKQQFSEALQENGIGAQPSGGSQGGGENKKSAPPKPPKGDKS